MRSLPGRERHRQLGAAAFAVAQVLFRASAGRLGGAFAARPVELRWRPGCGLAVALLLWAGASRAADPAELARGKEVFSKIQPACATCHTLQAAGAEGQVGPVLDELRPDAARVLRALKAGIGVMPSYAERMSDSDMKAVASFVAHAAGGGK